VAEAVERSEAAPAVERKIVLAGVGGQGVIFAARLLARAASGMGHPVLVSETHGMSQRGGSVLAHLKIGGARSPLIRRGAVDVLLAFDREEALRSLPFLRLGGAAFVNAADGLPGEVEQALRDRSVEIHCLPATRLALELGSAAVANVALLGFGAAHPSLGIPLDALREALGPAGAELNRRALESGAEAANKELSAAAAAAPSAPVTSIPDRRPTGPR
jgi:indolepyruvate ferredoxin oxidoreductase beta subunit